MDISIITTIEGVEYINLSDFSKEYYKRYRKDLNIAQAVKNIPKNYVLVNKGRNGRTLLNLSIVEMFFNSRRNIPADIIKDLYEAIELKSNHKRNSLEVFFIDLLSSFLKNMIHDIDLENQKTVGGKTFDLCINSRLLIEFDEAHHVKHKDNDDYKDQIAEANGYRLIRVNSISDYGLEISRIYKKVKIMFL